MLLGSGNGEEAAQAAWLDTVMQAASDRQIAWFLHRPLFLDNPDEADAGYWTVKPESFSRMIELVRRHSVILVASGHLHKAHQTVYSGTRYLWCPASSFLVGPETQPAMAGERRLGAVLYEVNGTALEPSIIDVPGLAPYWLDDVYPRQQADNPSPG
jgi:hypothetical protein